MRLMACLIGVLVSAGGGAVPLGHAQQADLDLDMVSAIKAEGLSRSEAMDIVGWLTDVYGPRLTGTPTTEDAKTWTMAKLREFGLSNVHEERFEFGRGWSLERFHVHMIKPQVMPIIGYPKSWTTSTNGMVIADVVRVNIESPRDLERYRGTLQGKVVLPQPVRTVDMLKGDVVLRMDQMILDEAGREPPKRASRPDRAMRSKEPSLDELVNRFYVDEGVVAVLDRGSNAAIVAGGPIGSHLDWLTQRTDGGTVFVGSGGSWNDNAESRVPAATIAVEHYNRLVRNLERGLRVEVEIRIQTRFHDEDDQPNAFNIIGDIVGTDLAHEVVILGAHFDSTHAATGATDNASGTAAMMEAMRILRAIEVRPRRTIRLGLWGAEEQGLLGSREYVAQHYADRNTMTLKPTHANVAAYYNMDNGAGRIRGIWLQENTAAAAVFRPWVKALADFGVSTLGSRSLRGTDHVSFDEVGIPGFQFIQDRLEYNSRTHHSNMDFFDRVQEEDLVQMSIVAAVFAYNTAMLDQRMPRKAIPNPTPRPSR